MTAILAEMRECIIGKRHRLVFGLGGIDEVLQCPVQLVQILQTEIFQPYVVDAILVIPRNNVVAYNDNLTIGVVYAP